MVEGSVCSKRFVEAGIIAANNIVNFHCISRLRNHNHHRTVDLEVIHQQMQSINSRKVKLKIFVAMFTQGRKQFRQETT